MVNTRSIGKRARARSRAAALPPPPRSSPASDRPAQRRSASSRQRWILGCPRILGIQKVPRRNSSTSIRTTSSVSASTASDLVSTVMPRCTPSSCRMSKCSRVCGLIDSSAAITSSTSRCRPRRPACCAQNARGPGRRQNRCEAASPFAPAKSRCAKPRSMVMPRRFSSASRSASMPVSAFTSAVFPWSMWPAVPTMIDFMLRES